MRSISDVVAHVRIRTSRPWLIVGKGPSWDRLPDRESLRERHYLLTLNHACTAIAADVAHFTDFEAFAACITTTRLEDLPARFIPHVCMPWHPHVEFRPAPGDLEDFSLMHPALLWLADQNKLLSYNSSRAVDARLSFRLDLPTIRVRYFSAVAAVNILAAAGHKEIFTVGVDGGTGYARQYDTKDRLSNGRTSFDVQFQEIDRTCKIHGVKVTPLVPR